MMLSKILEITPIAFWIIALLLLFTYFFWIRQAKNLPLGPTGMPILGYIPFLSKDRYIDFYEMSKKYGDIFGLYLWTSYVVVVSDHAIAKKLFRHMSTSDRPPGLFEVMPGGVGFGELNGPDWVEQRRFTVQKLKRLGFGSSDFEKWIQVEALNFVRILEEKEGQPTNIEKPLSNSIFNMILALLTGRFLPTTDPRRDTVYSGIIAFQGTLAQSSLVAFLPRIYKMAVNLGFIRAKEKLKDMLEWHKFVKQNVKEISEDKNRRDSYIGEYLKEIEAKNELHLETTFDLKNLIGSVQTLVTAGSDTTKVSILWLFLAMASHPDIQDKVHKELDTMNGEIVYWEDRWRLPYCHATILEGQRWRTTVPLNVLHMTSEDIEVKKYIIPKGTCIIALLYAMHMDPRYWEDPEEFRPERFLEENTVVVNKNNYVPFSFGKRRCIGDNIAYVEIFLYFVSVMQKFKVLPADDFTVPDLKGVLGLNLMPKEQDLRFLRK